MTEMADEIEPDSGPISIPGGVKGMLQKFETNKTPTVPPSSSGQVKKPVKSILQKFETTAEPEVVRVCSNFTDTVCVTRSTTTTDTLRPRYVHTRGSSIPRISLTPESNGGQGVTGEPIQARRMNELYNTYFSK